MGAVRSLPPNEDCMMFNSRKRVNIYPLSFRIDLKLGTYIYSYFPSQFPNSAYNSGRLCKLLAKTLYACVTPPIASYPSALVQFDCVVVRLFFTSQPHMIPESRTASDLLHKNNCCFCAACPHFQESCMHCKMK